LKAICFHRRDRFVFKTGDEGVYNDVIWPLLKPTGAKEKCFSEFVFEHNSQTPLTLFINDNCIPPDRF